jgi:hypothetical protein
MPEKTDRDYGQTRAIYPPGEAASINSYLKLALKSQKEANRGEGKTFTAGGKLELLDSSSPSNRSNLLKIKRQKSLTRSN